MPDLQATADRAPAQRDGGLRSATADRRRGKQPGQDRPSGRRYPGDGGTQSSGAARAEGAAFGPNPNARVDKDGNFTLAGVAAGSHWIRSAGQLRGWSLKSVLVNGRDVVDTPIDLRSDQKLNAVSVVFTNKLTQVSGTVTNEQSMPVTDFTVLAFPADSSLWRPLARQIMTARPDQTGKYQIRGLPPGNYYLATVDPSEQGEWFEPAFLDQQRLGAARLLLSDGDVKTHDFRISTR